VQFDPEKLQSGGGSGLGLWSKFARTTFPLIILTSLMHCPVSHQVAELHSGSLSVLSEGEGHGCTFTFGLPLHREGCMNTTPHVSQGILSAPLQWIYGRDARVSNELNMELDSPLREQSVSAVSVGPVPARDMVQHNGGHSEEYSGGNVNPEERSNHISDLSSVDQVSPFLSTILVVDDVPLNRRMVKMMLMRQFREADILEAEDGVQAVSLYQACMDQNKAVQLILMDYMMPAMNGPTASKRIRDLGYEGVIFGVTGNALPEDIRTFKSHGATHVLIKPVDFKKLKAAIRKYCG
jgi:CheY-like chemotaxis protein